MKMVVSLSYPFEITEPEEINVIEEIIPINCFGETGTANFSIDGCPGTYTIFLMMKKSLQP